MAQTLMNMSKFSTRFYIMMVCVLGMMFITPVQANGADSYRKEGYPVITIVGGTLLILVSFYISYSSRKNASGTLGDSLKHNLVFTICSVFLYCVGVFLTFGPDTAQGIENPRAAIIGLQLLLQVAIGVYFMHHATPAITDAYIIFGIFNLLALFGSNWLFNYNLAIWTLDQNSCNVYFNGSALDTTKRCDDDGYLQFLRIMGHLASLVLLASVIYAISVSDRARAIFGKSDNYPATHHNPAYPATTTSNYPASAQPVNVASAPATSVPVNY